MSRFRIDHPTNAAVHAEAGHDPVLGFFVDVMKGERVIKSYDHFHPLFNRQRPLMGCLDFLVSEGFFTSDELHDALVWLQDGGRNPRAKGVIRVIGIVEAFKQAHA